MYKIKNKNKKQKPSSPHFCCLLREYKVVTEGINDKDTKLRLSHISTVPVLDPRDLFKRVQSLVNVCQVMLQLSHSHQLDSMDRVGIRVIHSLEGERQNV